MRKEAIKLIRGERVKVGRSFALGGLSVCVEKLCQLM